MELPCFTRNGKHQAGEASREPLPDETSPGAATTTKTTIATTTTTKTTPVTAVTILKRAATTATTTTATTSTTTKTTPATAVTILKRAATDATTTPTTGQDITEYRSLAQRIADYQQKRHEIFSAEIYRRRALTRRHRKILILRQRRRAYRRFQQKEISAIVSLEHDDRTKVDNTEVTALLDTGASVSCCGAGATRFLENRRHQVIKLRYQHVKTADGKKTSVTGLITLPVEWEGETRSIEFYIVPELQQQSYFGIDFWKAFALSVATKADTINSPSKCQVLDAISQGNDNPKSYRNSSLQLTDVKQNSLGEGKETFPHNTREKFSGSIEITSSTSPLRNRRQQQQQIQLNNAQTTITVVSHRHQLLPSSTAISDSASHANQNELAKRTRISKNLSSQHSTRRSSRPHPPATTVTTNQHLHQSQKQQQLEQYYRQ
ncbi:uncharacterized protein ACN2A1_013156 [Glossina fuscipes fuscipes]